MTSLTPLRVLHVEDSSDDGELLKIQLAHAGFDVTTLRVETAVAFDQALMASAWDVVVFDASLPTFDAPRALRLLRDQHIDLPFIVLSGTMSAAAAVEVMKAGAHDFVFKHEPARLEPIIRRELREAENRRARARAETEREQLIEKLETANRTKDEFLAMLGHELRNPLAPIVTALHLLRVEHGDQPSRELDIIQRQVEHLRRLVDDLLDVARITRGKVALTKKPQELSVVVQKALETARPLLDERQHRVTVTVPPLDLVVDADGARLTQVITNLLTNAARYTPPGGAIVVSAGSEGADVVVRVSDNGIGIEPSFLPTIFDPFVQGAQRLDRKEGGLGIGLALVHNLVALHGGSVAALSAGAGHGSEFVVRLPASTAPREVSADMAIPRPRHLPGDRRVLVVDDNVDAADLLGAMLGLHGYVVEVAHDGPAALAIVERFDPAVVVLDIGLPQMDGLEVARRIRQQPGHGGVTLIALTGYGQAADRASTKNAGFDLHLVKPVDSVQLLRALSASFAGAADPPG